MSILMLSESVVERLSYGDTRVYRDRVLCGFCIKVGRRIKTFIVATSVNGHALPITPIMKEILERRIEATADDKIFDGMSAEHVSSMAQRAGAPRFMLHDLRKMFATVGEKIGVRESVLRGLLNHVAKKSDTLNRHYVQLAISDLQAPLATIQESLISLGTLDNFDLQ